MDEEKSDRLGLAAIGHEIKRHSAGYILLAGFMLAGLILIRIFFPDTSIWVGVVGGFAFGVYVTLFAMPDKFL
jgi:hypothetical protein